MTRFVLRNLLVSVVLSFAYSGLFAQTYCDDLTEIQPYDVGSDSLLSITDSILVGDTVSIQNAYNIIELGGIYTNWYYSSNYLGWSGIFGDAHFKITPVYEVENLSMEIYHPINSTLIPTFVLNGDSSLSSGTVGFQAHSLSDFPMIVNGITVSIDTNLPSTIVNGNTYYGYKLVFDGNVEELILIHSIDLGQITKICYESSTLDIEESEQINTLFPNPTSEYFQIQSNDKFTSIRMYNMLGNEVLHQSLDYTDNIDCSHLTSGLYVVVLKDKYGKLSTQKLVVE